MSRPTLLQSYFWRLALLPESSHEEPSYFIILSMPTTAEENAKPMSMGQPPNYYNQPVWISLFSLRLLLMKLKCRLSSRGKDWLPALLAGLMRRRRLCARRVRCSGCGVSVCSCFSRWSAGCPSVWRSAMTFSTVAQTVEWCLPTKWLRAVLDAMYNFFNARRLSKIEHIIEAVAR